MSIDGSLEALKITWNKSAVPYFKKEKITKENPVSITLSTLLLQKRRRKAHVVHTQQPSFNNGNKEDQRISISESLIKQEAHISFKDI